MEKCFYVTASVLEHEAKNSEGRSRSYCSRWAGAGCQKFGSFPADGEVFFLDIPFYRTPHLGAFSRPKFLGGRSRPPRAARGRLLPACRDRSKQFVMRS